MPPFHIVDGHVHFYDTERLSYAWLAGVPKINRTHLPADFEKARGEVAVEKIVFVEVDAAQGQTVAEARFAAELARADPRIQGIVASARVEHGVRVRDELDALGESGLVKGIRRLVQQEADPEFCLRPAFVEGVRLLAGYGLSFDLGIVHHQLAAATELLRRCPDVQFVIDHMAKPGIKAGLLEPWKSQMREIAKMPHVVSKISGAVTEADHQSWTVAQLRPYIEHCIDCFGFDRVMFASDWPVVELAANYPDWVRIVEGVVAAASEDERRKLFRDTAIRVYRLPL